MATIKMQVNGENFPEQVAGIVSAVFTGKTVNNDGDTIQMSMKQRGDYLLALQDNKGFANWVKSLGDAECIMDVQDENDDGDERIKRHFVAPTNIIRFGKLWLERQALKASMDSLVRVVRLGAWGERGRRSTFDANSIINNALASLDGDGVKAE